MNKEDMITIINHYVGQHPKATLLFIFFIIGFLSGVILGMMI